MKMCFLEKSRGDMALFQSLLLKHVKEISGGGFFVAKACERKLR